MFMKPLTRTLGTLALITQLTGCGDPGEFPDVATAQQSIIDGHRSSAADFPSTGAMIMEMKMEDEVMGTPICSGTLIAPDVVLTAAHCTPGDAMFGAELQGFEAQFYFTFHPDLTAFDTEDPILPPRTTAVTHWINHPDYVGNPENIDATLDAPFRDGLNDDKDIALLFLTAPVVDVTPTPILRPHQADALAVGAAVQVAGYGQQQRDAQAEDPSIKFHGPSVVHEVGEFELQVGDRASLSAPAPRPGLATKCYGDSGGPTYLSVSGQLFVAGVTSRGYDDQPDCNRAGIDTRVDVNAAWIDDVMKAGCQEGRRIAKVCAGASASDAPRGIARPEPTTAYPTGDAPAYDDDDRAGGCDIQAEATHPGWLGLLMLGVLGLIRRRPRHVGPRGSRGGSGQRRELSAPKSPRSRASRVLLGESTHGRKAH